MSCVLFKHFSQTHESSDTHTSHRGSSLFCYQGSLFVFSLALRHVRSSGDWLCILRQHSILCLSLGWEISQEAWNSKRKPEASSRSCSEATGYLNFFKIRFSKNYQTSVPTFFSKSLAVPTFFWKFPKYPPQLGLCFVRTKRLLLKGENCFLAVNEK